MTLAEHTARLLAETREEAARADTKAEVLTAAYGILVGATLAGIAGGDWAPSRLGHVTEAVFWSGTLLVACAWAALGYTLWPRTRHEKSDGSASYFGHVRDYRDEPNRDALVAALTSAAADAGRDVEELEVLSDIVWCKYVGIQVAMVSFALGAVGCAAAAIIG
jgi:hypothetical protein